MGKVNDHDAPLRNESRAAMSHHEITSPLLKSAMLATYSTLFPRLVQAAARRQGVPYGPGLLDHVAQTPAVADAVVVYEEGSVDAWLLDHQGPEIDDLILDAVASYPEGA